MPPASSPHAWPPRNSRDVVLNNAVLLVSEASRGIILSTLFAYLTAASGSSSLAPATVTALAVSLFSVGRLLANYGLGYWVDKTPLRRVFIACLLAQSVGHLIYTTGYSSGVPGLLLSRFVIGFASGVLGACRAFVAATEPPALRTRQYAILGMSKFVGYALTPGVALAFVATDFIAGGSVFNGNTLPGYVMLAACVSLAGAVFLFMSPVSTEAVPPASTVTATVAPGLVATPRAALLASADGAAAASASDAAASTTTAVGAVPLSMAPPPPATRAGLCSRAASLWADMMAFWSSPYGSGVALFFLLNLVSKGVLTLMETMLAPAFGAVFSDGDGDAGADTSEFILLLGLGGMVTFAAMVLKPVPQKKNLGGAAVPNSGGQHATTASGGGGGGLGSLVVGHGVGLLPKPLSLGSRPTAYTQLPPENPGEISRSSDVGGSSGLSNENGEPRRHPDAYAAPAFSPSPSPGREIGNKPSSSACASPSGRVNGTHTAFYPDVRGNGRTVAPARGESSRMGDLEADALASARSASVEASHHHLPSGAARAATPSQSSVTLSSSSRASSACTAVYRSLGCGVLHSSCVTHAKAWDSGLLLGSFMLTALGAFLASPPLQSITLGQLALGFTLIWSVGAPIADVLTTSMFSVLVTTSGGKQGRAQGWITAAGSSGRILFPLLFGFLSHTAVLVFSGLCCLACAALAAVFLLKTGEGAPPSTVPPPATATATAAATSSLSGGDGGAISSDDMGVGGGAADGRVGIEMPPL